MAKIYLNIILTLLLAAVVVMGIALVNSYDRMYFASQELLKEMRSKTQMLPAESNAADLKISSVKAANAEFFDPEAVQGGSLTTPISADTANLNYLINNDAYAAEFYSLCNSSLAERNYEHPENFEPMLAESWTVSEDKKSYIIKLRPQVYWQSYIDPESGREVAPELLTTGDFKFFTDVVRNTDVNASALRVYYKDLDCIEIIDDLTMIVRWKNAKYGNMSATLTMMPLPKHFYCGADGKFDGKKFNNDHKRNRMIVGCGAYRFVKWDKNSRLIFERNENYWGKNYGIMPPLEKLVYEFIQHPNTRYQALLAGSIDQSPLTPEQWTVKSTGEEFAKANLRKYRYLSSSYFYIGYNLKNPLFQDKKVRQALTMLVDRERIIRDIYKGEAEQVIGPFAPNSVYYDRSIKPFPCDVEAAKKLFAECGWQDTDNDGILDKDGRKFVFSILAVASHPIQEKMLPLIKENMAKAGVDMKIQTIEWSVYVQRLMTRDFEVCTLGWTSPIDPEPYQLWHSDQADVEGSSNHISFKNKKADELIEKLQFTFDMNERIKIAHEFQQLIHDEQPYTFLFAPYALNAVSERYRNFRQFPSGAPSVIWYLPQQYISGEKK